ncbi:MAG: hypothetical protein IT373_05910 [Polyangiaceae bacterium]|nr:hypothetical protein [Polyangiaceae bacterium]
MNQEPHPDPMRLPPRRALVALALGAALPLGACAGPPTAQAPRPEPAPVTAAAAAPDPARQEPHATRLAVRFGDPHRIAGVLADLFEPGQRPDGEVRAVLVDEATRELVVFATDAGLERVRAILSPGCDLAPPDEERVEVFPLEHAAAGAVAHTLLPLLPRGARVVPEDRSNTLLVAGPARERASVLALARALDVPAAERR